MQVLKFLKRILHPSSWQSKKSDTYILLARRLIPEGWIRHQQRCENLTLPLTKNSPHEHNGTRGVWMSCLHEMGAIVA